MKRTLLFLGIAFAILSCGTTESPTTTVNPLLEIVNRGEAITVARSAPFSRGVNFSDWFETWGGSAESINFTKYKEQDFVDVKSLGVDVIRLPIHFHHMTSGAPNYTIDPLLLRFIDTAVDWAEKHELYIIIDNHSFDPIQHTPNDVDKVLLPVWAQVAQRYRNRSNFVVYEILNEPHGIADSLWGEIQGKAIETIRRYDPNKTIIVGGTGYNSIEKMFALPNYTDPNLIYTFHFYDPHIFTHQGASWGTPDMSDLAGIPFPYDRNRMPRVPESLRGTWVEGTLLHDYHRQASPQVLLATLDRAVQFSIERDVPIFCGEFGVFIPNSLQEDRVRWYEFIVAALNRRGIAWTSWDYYGGFGIFKDGIRGDFNSDLNVEVVRAMGFTVPTQTPRENRPFADGFVIYDDYPDSQLTVGHWGNNTIFSLYDSNTANGEFAIRWGNANQYDIFYFAFARNADLSNLAAQDFYLEFQARTQTAVNFEIRFVNPETPNTMPWRMSYTINQSNLPPDGRWHTIRIPLAQMRDTGAWVNATRQWHSPRGEFNWENIRGLEFVAEHGDMTNQIIWFDNIKITR